MACSQHPVDLVGVPLVEQQDRMDVTVAGVEAVDDPQAVLLARLANAPEDFRKLSTRYDSILRAVAGTESSDGAECFLTAFP